MANVKKLKINNTSYDIAVSSVEKVDGLNEALEAKQDVISDLEEIRSGAELGSTSIQPGDNVSELTNDANYQNGTQVNSAISAHNTSTTAHSDIRQELSEKADDSDLQAHIDDKTNPHEVTKAQVGLGNVDNTADLDKPISTATQEALDTKENVSNKTTVINSSSTDTQYPTAKATFEMGQDIREIAEGKTKSFVVSYEDNPDFDSQDAEITITDSFVDINGTTHSVSELKLGDSIYVKETDVPDRWCSNPSSAEPKGVTLYKLETAKVPVTDVQINGTTIVNNTIANIPVASSDTLGVIKTSGQYGTLITAEGQLCTNRASNTEIENKNQYYKPIVPVSLDKAIMEGLGNNSLTWTDAYKASARTTIGAQEIISDLDEIRAGAELGSTSIQPGDNVSELTNDSKYQTETQLNAAITIHNTSTTAHNDIRTSLNNEINARQQGDVTLSGKIDTETQDRIEADLGLSEDITANTNAITEEVERATGVEEGLETRISANETAIEDLSSSKQDVIEDLEEIRENAEAGKSASDTIATYGNIVTHNTSEFATSAQGALADSAIQPGDNISELTNDSNYQTNTQVNTAISTHNTSSTAHSDIRSAINEKQDTLTAGSNIDITNNVISATDTTYSAGNGLTLTGTTFSANVVDNTSSESTTNALSARVGKVLQEQIDNLQGRGKYLSIWDCTTGLAMDEPPVNPYTIETGSYFIVGKVGTTNYRPNGGVYDKNVPSTSVEIAPVKVNDTYFYDGTQWRLLATPEKTISFSTIAGSPYDNTNLASALNDKQDVIDDLEIIRSDAEAGKEASDTIASYGDIVTHDVDEFATAAQGAKADTALQPGDDISELNNDSGYQTETQLNSAISTHNTSNTAHNDIRTTLGNKQDKTDNTLTTTAKTIVGAINELDARPAAPAIDNKTISKNASEQLQTVAVVDQANTNNILKEWSGTELAYQALSVKDSNTIYYTY